MSLKFEKRKAEAIADHSAGRLPAAERIYRSLLSDRPFDANILYLLGTLRLQRNDPEEGFKYLTKTVEIAPDFQPAQVNLATVLTHLKQYEEAIQLHDQILRRNPNNPIVWNVRGLALRALGRFKEAAESADRAIGLEPTNAEFQFNRAESYGMLNRFDSALTSVTEALRLRPDWPEAHQVRGAILHQLTRYEEALACHDHALGLSPNLVAALDGKGMALRALHRPDEALVIHEHVLHLQPNRAAAHSNRGVALLSLLRPREAEEAFSEALSLDPNFADAQYNRGLARLQMGDYAGGWSDYEHRWKLKSFPSKPPKLNAPFWDGAPLDNRTLLVFAEQGRGDVIQFSRLLSWATKQGGPVRFSCPPRMIWMFEGVYENLTVESNTVQSVEPDLQIALMSLPHLVGLTLETVPQSDAYIRVNDQLIAHAKSHWHSEKLKVGICWAGSQEMRFSLNRFITLEMLAPLMEVGNLEFISLQEPKTNQELYEDISKLGIKTLPSDADSGLEAFVDTAAAIMAFDLVITVDTAIAHLAGSLGKPVWIMLTYAPDWRWLHARSDSPWYPSARLFRQQKPGDWQSVIAEIAAALADLAAAKANQA
jgi:tetratricopeptide (TPR) repeat protein